METAYKAFYALILTGIGLLCKELLDLSPQLAKHPQFGPYVHAAIVIGMGFLFYQSRNITSAVLAGLPLLRRLLARGDFIEGDWPLVVIDCRDGSLKYMGLLTVSYRGGYLVVSGQDWNPDGTHALTFKSMQTYYSEGTLHYWYMQGAGGLTRGYTFIEFFPREKVATHLTGVFHDKEHPDVRFYGRKLKYRWFEARKTKLESRRACAKAFADEIMPAVPALLKTPVDAAWE